MQDTKQEILEALVGKKRIYNGTRHVTHYNMNVLLRPDHGLDTFSLQLRRGNLTIDENCDCNLGKNNSSC